MPRATAHLPLAIATAAATAIAATAVAVLVTVLLAAQRAHAAAHGQGGAPERPRGRRAWVRERPPAWWDTTAQEFDDAEFRSHFRMGWETFYFVADTLRPQIQRKDTRWRQALGFQKVTAMALYRLATGHDYRTIASLFGCNVSTVQDCTLRVCRALVHHAPAFIRMPTSEEELRELAAASASLVRDAAGMPHAPLMCDGCHIRIPFGDRQEGHMDWKSRKGFYAMVLQGICDHRSLFRSVQAGWCGSVHDSRAFRASTVGQNILAGTVFGGLTSCLPDGTKLPMAVLVDSAYPKATCTIKPNIDGGTLTDPQLWYDYVQSVQRQPIERAFGRLKGRWRTLLLRAYHKLEYVALVIIACCVLHNICEQRAELFDEGLAVHEDAEDVVDSTVAAPDASASQVAAQRDALVAYLWQHAPAEVKLLGVREWREKYGRFVRRREAS